jgi:hypothetical protein
LLSTDWVGEADYVVTSVVDSFVHGDDTRALSVREAIDLANGAADVPKVWVPAWGVVLVRDRATYGGGSSTDMNVSFGDLDITQTMVIRGSGIAGATSVKWRLGVVDAVFDLLGDYNGNGVTTQDNGWVEGSDWMIWQQQLGSTGPNLSADGDDDGDVDGADLTVHTAHYGNTLEVIGIN